jgi:hypothetical protein
VEPPTREQLFEQYAPLACRLARKDLPYHRQDYSSFDFEERRQVALAALWEAIPGPGQYIGNLRAYFRAAIKSRLTDLARQRQREEDAEKAAKEAARPARGLVADPVQLILDAEAEAEVAALLDRVKGEDGWGFDFDVQPYLDCLAGRLEIPDLIAQQTALAKSTAYDRLKQVAAWFRERLRDYEPEGRPATPRKDRPVANLDSPQWRRRRDKLAELWEFVAFDCARNRLNIPETQVSGTMETTIRADWPDPREWVAATLFNIQGTLPVVPPRWRETPLPKAPEAARNVA